MSKPVRFVLFAGVLVVLVYFLKEAVFSDSAYIAGILKERKDKNLSFRGSQNSPFEEAERLKFDSLNYYAPDILYKVDADYQVYPKPDTLRMPLTTGETEPYLKFGKATFNLGGQSHALELYLKVNSTDSSLFVPFNDKTNSRGTYGGGRFLDVPKPAPDAKTITLDFNKAYNPFCVFNYSYSCPVPPPANRLTVEVPVGEKDYVKK